jgi:hypothetical protein
MRDQVKDKEVVLSKQEGYIKEDKLTRVKGLKRSNV